MLTTTYTWSSCHHIDPKTRDVNKFPHYSNNVNRIDYTGICKINRHRLREVGLILPPQIVSNIPAHNVGGPMYVILEGPSCTHAG